MQRSDDSPGLVESLREGIARALQKVLPPGEPYALLDFPDHGNVGDSAIWVGARNLLADMGVPAPAYRCSLDTYDRDRLARRLPQGTILIHGGGNFGDVWPRHQRFRETVIADFPGHRIVQLPQTVHFADPNALRRSARVVQAHDAFVLMVRDERSREVAERGLGVEALLVPDTAFGLRPLGRTRSEVPIVVLARGDREARRTSTSWPADVHRIDWVEDDPAPLLRVQRALSRLASDHPRRLGWLPLPLDAVAAQRLDRGRRALGRGRVVVTDRLHGHILCLLIGIPHVLLDNSYGKNRGFYEAWTRDSPLVRWSDSMEAAVAEAREMARDRD